jgi:hypothetical protein
MYVKATKLSRRSRSARAVFARAAKTAAFVGSMYRYDREVISSSRRCLERFASRRVTQCAVYGANDVGEVLWTLTREFPVTICAVYDDYFVGRFAGCEVSRLDSGVGEDIAVVVASLVGIEDRVDRLVAAGVAMERIVLLRTNWATVCHDRP